MKDLFTVAIVKKSQEGNIEQTYVPCYRIFATRNDAETFIKGANKYNEANSLKGFEGYKDAELMVWQRILYESPFEKTNDKVFEKYANQ